jgi:hypothetical protein
LRRQSRTVNAGYLAIVPFASMRISPLG